MSLDEDAFENYKCAVGEADLARRYVHDLIKIKGSRELSIAKTKLDEAILWLDEWKRQASSTDPIDPPQPSPTTDVNAND